MLNRPVSALPCVRECSQIRFEFTQLLRRRHTVVTIAIHLRCETTTPAPKLSGHNQGETIFYEESNTGCHRSLFCAGRNCCPSARCRGATRLACPQKAHH